MTGFCGTGTKLKLYKYQTHSKCPRCETDNEDTDHVLQCPHPDAKHSWDEAITKLEVWMTENKGHPELVELICLGLNSWHKNDRVPLTYGILEPHLKTAWSQQRQLGWKSFIEGYWSQEWQICQAQYLSHINSQKSSLLWISRVQRRIWMIAWNLWEHRNRFLHNEGRTIHSFETKALDKEIQSEWETGLGQLDPSYNYLFNGNLHTCLNDTIHKKLMWIISVWSARDNDITIGPPRTRNTIVINLYDRWKKKNAIMD
jgi:hypothetical protein